MEKILRYRFQDLRLRIKTVELDFFGELMASKVPRESGVLPLGAWCAWLRGIKRRK